MTEREGGPVWNGDRWIPRAEYGALLDSIADTGGPGGPKAPDWPALRARLYLHSVAIGGMRAALLLGRGGLLQGPGSSRIAPDGPG